MKGGSVLKDGKSSTIYTKNIYGIASLFKLNVYGLKFSLLVSTNVGKDGACYTFLSFLQ